VVAAGVETCDSRSRCRSGRPHREYSDVDFQIDITAPAIGRLPGFRAVTDRHPSNESASVVGLYYFDPA